MSAAAHVLTLAATARSGLEGMGTPRAARSSAGSRPARPTRGRGGAWSAYPHSAATSASGRSPELAARDALEPGHPLVLLRRQPGLLPDQRRRGAAGCSRPRRRPSPTGSPRVRRGQRPADLGPRRGVAVARPAPRPAPAATTASASSGRSAVEPLGQVGAASGATSSSSSSSPASSAAGTPSSARAPAVVSAELDPALVAVVVDLRRARRAARRPSTSAPPRLRPSRPADLQRLADRQHERQAASTAARGARRARPGRRRRPSARRRTAQRAGTAATTRRQSRSLVVVASVAEQLTELELRVSSSAPSSSRVRSRSSPDLSRPSCDRPDRGCGSAGGPGGRRGRAAGGRSGCGPRG